MLDREVVKLVLTEKIDLDEIPNDVNINELVETLSLYIEYNFYDWIKENTAIFLNFGEPNWDWIRKQILLEKENQKAI